MVTGVAFEVLPAIEQPVLNWPSIPSSYDAYHASPMGLFLNTGIGHVPDLGSSGFLSSGSGFARMFGGGGVDEFFNSGVANENQELDLGFIGLGGSEGAFGPSVQLGGLGIDASHGAMTGVGVVQIPSLHGLTLLQSLEVLQVGADRQVAWRIPSTMFGHNEALAAVAFSMVQADGRPLPNWLQFDAQTGELKGHMPNAFQGELTLRLTARDSQGRTVATTIKLGAPDVSNARSGAGARAGVSEQFARVAQQRAGHTAGQRLHG